MDKIKQIALEKGIAYLKTTGLRFAIEQEDGTICGELPVKVVKAPRVPKTDRVVKWRWMDEHPTYLQQIKTMQPGEIASWTVASVGDERDDKARVASFRATIGSQARVYIGKENFVMQLDGPTVQLMRVL